MVKYSFWRCTGVVPVAANGIVKNIARSVALLFLCSPPAFADIYKCADANGKTQYTDKPCAGKSSVFTPKKAPVVDEDNDERMRKTNKLLNAMQAERNQEKQAAAEQKAEKERRQRNCNSARDRYRRITQASRLYDLDKDGNRVVFNDTQRAQAEAGAKANVDKWCD